MSPMTAPLVLVEPAPHVLRVTINRAEKRNALSQAVLEALRETFAHHAADESLSVVVLTAAGDRSFAAGGDLRELDAVRAEAEAAAMAARARTALDAVRHFPVPVIAALNGDAIGGGAELALACDLRIAAAHARVGFVQGRLNISTAWGGGIDLMRLLGPSRGLMRLCLGDLVGGAEGIALGLLDAVAEPTEPFETFVARFVEPFRRQAPLVARAFKAQALAERLGTARAERADTETRLFSRAWVHEDHWAAVERLLSGQGGLP
jgi:enoyl-CoA hydratase